MKRIAFVFCLAGALLLSAGCKTPPAGGDKDTAAAAEKKIAKGNHFCHIELMTADVEKAKAFYGKIFDWKMTTSEGPMPYTNINTGALPTGGMMALPGPNIPVSWTVYVLVDDVEKTLEKVKAQGGKIIKGKMEIPGMCSFAIIADPQGGVIGIWEHKKK
jgi:predicted enzyme related to lactoylglutathione lyase